MCVVLICEHKSVRCTSARVCYLSTRTNSIYNPNVSLNISRISLHLGVSVCVIIHARLCINIQHTHRNAHIYTCCCVRNVLFRMRRTSGGHTAESACDLKVFSSIYTTPHSHTTQYHTLIHTHTRATYDILFILKIADRAWPVSLSCCRCRYGRGRGGRLEPV